MKIWKLVSGILSIFLFAVVCVQSYMVSVINMLEETGEMNGIAGIFVSLMLLAGGIVSIITRSGSKAGDIALVILYGVGAFLGYAFAGSYGDLNIWATWSLICAIVNFVVMRIAKGRAAS